MAETCNSKRLSWLVKSCWPNPQPEIRQKITRLNRVLEQNEPENRQNVTFSTLPEDLVMEILSRISPSSLQSAMLVCRKWTQILNSGDYYDLRRNLNRLRQVVCVVAGTNSGPFSSTHYGKESEIPYSAVSNHSLTVLSLHSDSNSRISPFSSLRKPEIDLDWPDLVSFISHAQTAAIGRNMFILGQDPTCNGRSLTLLYDPWSGTVAVKAPMLCPRKKFAAGVVAGKIYVAGGASRREGFRAAVAAVEEYDPTENRWRIVAEMPRNRYGCVGAAVNKIFYVIGGLKLAGNSGRERVSALQPHVYASSMDCFDVDARVWLKSRAVPGGGCAVAGCAAGGYVFVLASHAVELSFWRFDARRRGGGEWRREKNPPVPAPVRVDNAVRFSCVGVGKRIFLVQVSGCIDDILRRSGRVCRGFKEGLVLVYDYETEEWSRGPDLPECFRRGAVCASIEC